jgi:hypothetical protein
MSEVGLSIKYASGKISKVLALVPLVSDDKVKIKGGILLMMSEHECFL